MSTNEDVVNRNIEIISVLCKQNLTFKAVLTAVQKKYPESEWDQDTLKRHLTSGAKVGRFLRLGNNPSGPIQGYGINPKMMRASTQNWVYGPYCNRILPMGPAASNCSGCR